jgi:hypothetical protein
MASFAVRLKMRRRLAALHPDPFGMCTKMQCSRRLRICVQRKASAFAPALESLRTKRRLGWRRLQSEDPAIALWLHGVICDARQSAEVYLMSLDRPERFGLKWDAQMRTTAATIP